MNLNKHTALAAQLEALRDITDIYGPKGKKLLEDIRRLAREDLPALRRLWEDHVPASVRNMPGAMPDIVRVANIVHSRYEGRENRQPQQLYWERDAELRHPEAKVNYEGTLVGATPDFIIQKVNDDFILHRRLSLTDIPSPASDNLVRIQYPFSADGVAIVNTLDDLSKQSDLQHGMAMNHERQLTGDEIQMQGFER